jgi:4,5-DOPA dioxygenase extradiol
MQYREKAPGVNIALPTHEHFVPLIVAMGAALEDPKTPTFPIEGFWLGSLTRRSVQFG